MQLSQFDQLFDGDVVFDIGRALDLPGDAPAPVSSEVPSC